ncbi:hypothetical protein SLE2022_237190 [Rubroshorea leprosula]
MAEETQKPEAASSAGEVVVEKPVTEKDLPPAPEPEPEAVEKPVPVVEEKETVEEAVEEVEKAKAEVEVEEKITQSVSFKEETNVVGELPESQRKALEELKQLIQEALNKHEFTAPAVKEEEKAPEPVVVEKKEEVKEEEKKEEETPAKPAEEETKVEIEEKAEVSEKVVEIEAPAPVEAKKEEKAKPAAEAAAAVETVVVTEVVETAAVVIDEDGAKTVEAIEETVVAVSAPASVETGEASASKEPESAPAEEPKEAETPAPPPPPPEEVSIWGILLLVDERTDVILLKFLRARDFKVKDAFIMIKNTVRWRKDFGIDALLEEDLGNELDKVVFMHGFDKQGHPVCYNAYGEFQNKELYQSAFADEEKRLKFLRWRIQFLEKSIRKLDFSPNGINTIVQDNYPEFVARQVFINVPWWYLAFNKMISPFLTQRTKSKFVFSSPAKSADTLFKYIAPEQVPVQYGGLSKEGEQEFTTDDPVTEFIIKPSTKHTVEYAVSEKSILVWELRVVGWDVSYGAEFVPSVENGYTIIVSKTRRVNPADEPVISDSFKVGEPGKIVLTFDNQTYKKKKLLYRSKTKPCSD